MLIYMYARLLSVTKAMWRVRVKLFLELTTLKWGRCVLPVIVMPD